MSDNNMYQHRERETDRQRNMSDELLTRYFKFDNSYMLIPI